MSPPTQEHTTSNPQPTRPTRGPYKPTLILHGGAGHITRTSLPPTLYAQYHASLLTNLTKTHNLLLSGASAIEAACHAVCHFEDDPLFNCGRGSVFTSAGEIEMEASLAVASVDENAEFEGMVKRSAAVSMVRRTRHPILLAREVLRSADADAGLGGIGTMHGHLSGKEVEDWGFRKGLERKGKSWFWTKRRWEEHRRGLGKQNFRCTACAHGESACDVSVEGGCRSGESWSEDSFAELPAGLMLPSQGTVGAVCMDSWGVIAVATSTGGLTNKKPGRIGDTPTIGAGFWAESWNEHVNIDPNKKEHRQQLGPRTSVSQKLAAVVRSELGFWLGDCVGSSTTPNMEIWNSHSSQIQDGRVSVENGTYLSKKASMSSSHTKSARTRAVAMSGTGNGDSFLRTNACRTAAAICRFSSKSLQNAVQAVAGPEGELQKSAGCRWGKTGEGQGGIIGIEVFGDEKEGQAVFDFNCGGLWRAYLEKDKDGEEQPRIMVFREEY